MARDLPINTPLYFFDSGSGISTGVSGDAGDSDDFYLPLPPGMTEIEPPTPGPYQVARFTGTVWELIPDGSYESMTPTEQAAVDKQAAIDAAQNLVDEKFAETIDLTIQFLEEKFDLTPVKQAYLDGATTIEELKTVLVDTLSMTAGQKAIVAAYHTDYAAWLAAKDA